MAQSGMRNVGRRRRSRARKCKWRQLMLSLHLLPVCPPPPLLKLMLCQQARTSYDAAYLLLLFLPLVLLLLLLLLKFSMPLLSNNLLAIFCHRRVFYFPHSQSFFFLVPWWLKVRDGQHEHVADKGGGAVKDFVCSLYSTACLPAVESALRVPFLLCFLLCPAAIKTDHKMASKALPAKKKTNLFLFLCNSRSVREMCFWLVFHFNNRPLRTAPLARPLLTPTCAMR